MTNLILLLILYTMVWFCFTHFSCTSETLAGHLVFACVQN